MRGGKVLLNSIAAGGLAVASTVALADHIPGHDDCDPQFPMPLPGQEFWDGNGAVFFVFFIGPLGDSVITNTTFDITYVSDGTTPASDLFMEISVCVDDTVLDFSVTGADLGFGSGPGTFEGTLQTDVLNGLVCPGFPGPNTVVEFTVDVVGGGAVQGTAFFVDSFITFDVIPPPPCPQVGCGTGGACLDGMECVTECGELVQGVECVLLQADSGGLFLLENLDGFNVGDRVEVTGCLDPACQNICLQGDGCIFQNTIAECVPPSEAPRTLIIKQGACPAPVNPASNGVTPMVLAGDVDFDVNDIDPSSLLLTRCDGVGGAVAPNDGPPGPSGIQVNDLNHPNPEPATCQTGGCTCNDDQTSDGLDDLQLKFDSTEMAVVLGLDVEPVGAIITLVLSGTLNDGTAFTASDCIRVVGPGAPFEALAVSSNLPKVWVDVFPLDDALDDGGYTSFSRYFQQSTVVTVSAPHVPENYPNWILDHILIDGVKHAANDGSADVAIGQNAHSVVLQYRRQRTWFRAIDVGGNATPTPEFQTQN
jgi:hypothetical protein